jgi:hypothetical protein
MNQSAEVSAKTTKQDKSTFTIHDPLPLPLDCPFKSWMVLCRATGVHTAQSKLYPHLNPQLRIGIGVAGVDIPALAFRHRHRSLSPVPEHSGTGSSIDIFIHSGTGLTGIQTFYKHIFKGETPFTSIICCLVLFWLYDVRKS